jgi:hypothetical protein
MSEGCGNPNCPTHGNSPKSIALRQAKAEILSNEEFMDLIRTLAANAHQSVQHSVAKMTGYLDPDATVVMTRILSQQYDGDAVVQGLIDGFAVLMAGSHEPTKIMLTECSKVKEEPFLIERLTAAQVEEEMQQMQGHPRVMMFTGVEDLMRFLKGGR